MRRPFYKKSHGAWYCQLKSGKQVCLVRGEKAATKDAAETEFHKRMATEQPVTSKTTVAALVERFLEWIRENRKPGTHEWYRNHCMSFVRSVGPRLKVADLKPYHVDAWLKVHGKNRSAVTVGDRKGRQTKRTGTDNSKTYLNGGCRAVARAFNWAKKQGLIPASPIAGMERPAAKRRDAYLTLDQWKALIGLVDSADPFHDLLVFLWETGARPYEARMARGDNFDKSNRQIILDLKDSKGETYQRFILLNDRAFEIVCRLAGDGPIFRHKNGGAWAARSIQTRLTKLSQKLGFKVIPYIIRHSWITRALINEVDPLTVGILAGHRDATQVMRTYGHVAQDRRHLAAKLRQATREDAA